MTRSPALEARGDQSERRRQPGRPVAGPGDRVEPPKRTGWVRVQGPPPKDVPLERVAEGYLRASDLELLRDHFTVHTQARMVERAWHELGAWLIGYHWDLIRATDPKVKRPGYARVLADAETGKYGTLIVSRRDRFGRAGVENGLGRRRLRDADVRYYLAESRTYVDDSGCRSSTSACA